MRPTFDMDALRTMVVGIDLGSFARAASQLGRSQSAVSMQLKKLEQQAGRPLLRRNGRSLVPTEAGEALLAYARRIIALNDEAAASLDATAVAASVRMGLPQDLFEDVMTDAIMQFSRRRPGVHVEVRAGRNHALEEDVRAGRLDVAIAFFQSGSADTHGTRIASLPMLWLGAKGLAKPSPGDPIPLVVFDHPCLFRQTAIQTLDGKKLRWRLSLTTPKSSWRVGGASFWVWDFDQARAPGSGRNTRRGPRIWPPQTTPDRIAYGHCQRAVSRRIGPARHPGPSRSKAKDRAEFRTTSLVKDRRDQSAADPLT